MLRKELWRMRTLIAYTDNKLFPPGFSLHAPLMQVFTHSCRNKITGHNEIPGHELDLGGAYSPELRSVTLIQSDSIMRVLTANPMQSVRHLQVSCAAPHAMYLQFLNSLLHLVSLSLFGFYHKEQQPLEAPLTVTLQSLKYLHVSVARPTPQLLSHIHTPALESLELDFYGPDPFVEEMIKIICRDGMVKLRRLYLMEATFRTLVPMMLRKLEYLDTLIIKDSFMLDHLLTALEVPDQDFGSMCPNLTTLVISTCKEVPRGPFDNFVHCRMLADSAEPAPGFVTCLKLHGMRKCFGDHHFQHYLQTHSATIHITFTDDPDPCMEYFPEPMWEP